MSLFPFDTAFNTLNIKQREAVMQTEGPVMVIAGPGTGKTQILSMRIGNILRNAQVLPENILCLTYTDAGAVAMRERLRYLIGQDANKIKISTFHSFCNELIYSNPDIFPDFEEKALLDELSQIKILRKIIDEQDYGHPLKNPNSPYIHLRRFKDLLETLNREAISLKQLYEAIEKEKIEAKNRDEFIYKRNGNGFKKGDLREREYNEYCKKLEQTYQIALCSVRYHELVKEQNFYTFDDMIQQIILAFEHNPDFLAKCQEQFIYILVDEYQDTNGAQQKILNFLTEAWGQEANIFVVGDEDQSIFRFQGANMANITEFIQKYENILKVVVLQDNYRSTQSILRAAYKVLEQNNQRLERFSSLFKKNLIAQQNKDEKPLLIEVDNPRIENAFIIHEIQRIKKENPKLSLSEIAVLAPKNSDLEEIATLLKQFAIPYQIRKDTNILEHYLIKQVLNILHYLNPTLKGLHAREDLLFKILMSAVWQVDWIDVQKLFFTKHTPQEQQDTPRMSIMEYLDNPVLLQGLGIQNYLIFNSIAQKLKKWKWYVYAVPVMEVIQQVIQEGGFLSYAAQHQDKEELLLVLDTFYQHVYEWTKRNPKKGFKDLLNDLKEYEEFEIPIKINRWLGNNKGVFLSTYHSAKGLEFEHVYLIKCDEKSWKKGNSSGFKLPQTLIENYESKLDELEEQRRLFFVGMTRAKKHLNLVYARKNELQKTVPSNAFYQILEKLAPDVVEKKNIDVETENLLNHIANQFKVSVLPTPNLDVSQEIIQFYQQHFELSPSHVNTYLDCKRKFYYRYVLRIPTEPHHAAVYGHSIHAACKRFLTTYQETKTLPDADYLTKQFESILYEQKFMLTEQEYQDRLEQGKAELTFFYTHYQSYWEQAEYILSEQHLQTHFIYSEKENTYKVPLTGIIDKFLCKDGNFILIDYKTGRPDNIANRIKPYEGDYWRQILFYMYLLEQNNLKADIAKIYFFTPSKEENRQQEHEVILMDTYKNHFMEDLKKTIQGIMQGNFERVDVLEADKKCKDCFFKNLCWKEENTENHNTQ